MKKLAALTLAMVIALTMISALGEEGTDYSGIWYIITEDTTAGIAELNADGTMVWAPFKTADMAAGTVTMNADSKTVWTVTADGTASGTWEAADNGIKLFLEAGTLALALDSGALENSEREIKLSRETVQPKNVEKRFKSAFQPEKVDYTGIWYISFNGVTAGTAVLNKDGKMTWNIQKDVLSGKWEEEKNGDVKLTVEKDEYVLKAVNGRLEEDKQGIYLSRESEKVTTEMLAVFIESGELPENVSKEEMEAVISNIVNSGD